MIEWLACGTSYRVVSKAFSVPMTTAHRACYSICNVLIKHLSVIISRHIQKLKWKRLGEGFERLSRHAAFRRPVGAINGCYIGIRDPDLGQCYYNRKLHP